MPAVSLPRRMWALFEPIHVVTYFAPEARAAFEAAGLRGFWRGYFAGRAAPLGPVGPGPVMATFFGFARPMVTRALPDVWTRASPEAALEARLAGARTALDRLLSDVDTSTLAETAGLMRTAAEAIDIPGRALAGANADLPWPDDPLGAIWHAATLLREHRGDGHVATLLAAGLDGSEIQIWRTALRGGVGRQIMQVARGWTDEEWTAAAERLRARGWLAGSGDDETATDVARAAYEDIEATTDRLAMRPWQHLGESATARCAELLAPLTARVWTILPEDNPIGLERTRMLEAATG
jgi:hypothetical protein